MVSVVTESQMLYAALTQLLPSYTAVTFVSRYGSALCPLQHVPNPTGHIVLVDATMEPCTVIQWIKEWRALAPPATVITIETGRDSEQILAYIEAGVSGYLVQGASLGQVAATLCEINAGRTSCAPELLLRIFERLEDMALDREQEGAAEHSPLTFREQEILAWVEQGYSNREIADQLVIAVHTVKHHVHNILEKLHMRRRWEAARFARQQGWLN
jgi:DNA-binding NarL/FixJ family response regulator